MLPMPFALVALLGAALIAAPARAAGAEPDPRTTLTPEHAASCVAALRKEAETMADSYRQGQTEIEPELLKRLQQGFAFIGTAYLQGLRDEEGNKMLKQAEQAQESLPPAELAKRQASCRVEGSQLLERASALERAIVSQAARRRLDRLKRPRSS